ncbi:MAG: hypothetical protein ABEJ62_00850 [Candidatus Nanohaloarchaea archaeon]
MPRHVAVLFGDQVTASGDEPFTEDEDYNNENFAGFSEFGRMRDLEFAVAHHTWYGDGNLEKAWVHDGEWKLVDGVPVDGVYDRVAYSPGIEHRKRRIARENPVLNDPGLDRVCKDKFLTSGVFPGLVIDTAIATRQNMERMLEGNGSILRKRRYGLGGAGVERIEELGDENVPDEPLDWIVQPFVDSSQGVPGTHIDGMHDLRAVVAEGDIVLTYARMPGEGEVASNVGAGGDRTEVDLDEFPGEAERIVDRVEEEFERFEPAVYSVDVMFDTDEEPHIIELNSQPAVGHALPKSDSERERKAMQAVVETIEDRVEGP